MITDVLTLFHSSKRDTGHAQEITLNVGGQRTVDVLLYSRKELRELSGVVPIRDDPDYQAYAERLHESLQPEGGFLVHTSPHNGLITAVVDRVPGPEYAPPLQMLRLSPAEGPKIEQISEHITLQPGEHLILPSSAIAEKRLLDFYSQLKSFPTDLESSILNVIRRPSLEWRIDQIEKVLSLQTDSSSDSRAAAPQSRPTDFLDRAFRTLMHPVPLGPALAVTLILIAVALLFPPLRKASSEPLAQQEETPAEPTPTANQATPDPQTPAQTEDTIVVSNERDDRSDQGIGDTASDPLNALYDALAKSTDTKINALYVSHFQQRDVSGSPVVLGLTKLQALKMGWEPQIQDLQQTERIGGVKAAYSTEGLVSTLKSDRNAQAMLVRYCCTRYKLAGLPGTNGAPKPPVLFGIECDKVKTENVHKGLAALVKWVKGAK